MKIGLLFGLCFWCKRLSVKHFYVQYSMILWHEIQIQRRHGNLKVQLHDWRFDALCDWSIYCPQNTEAKKNVSKNKTSLLSVWHLQAFFIHVAILVAMIFEWHLGCLRQERIPSQCWLLVIDDFSLFEITQNHLMSECVRYINCLWYLGLLFNYLILMSKTKWTQTTFLVHRNELRACGVQ